jgi:hypothetical protein
MACIANADRIFGCRIQLVSLAAFSRRTRYRGASLAMARQEPVVCSKWFRFSDRDPENRAVQGRSQWNTQPTSKTSWQTLMMMMLGESSPIICQRPVIFYCDGRTLNAHRAQGTLDEAAILKHVRIGTHTTGREVMRTWANHGLNSGGVLAGALFLVALDWAGAAPPDGQATFHPADLFPNCSSSEHTINDKLTFSDIHCGRISDGNNPDNVATLAAGAVMVGRAKAAAIAARDRQRRPLPG